MDTDNQLQMLRGLSEDEIPMLIRWLIISSGLSACHSFTLCSRMWPKLCLELYV